MNKFCTEEALLIIRQEITSSSDNEVFFIGSRNIEGVIADVSPIARGSKTAVPAIINRAHCGDVVIHNHPSGRLEPSSADMDIASICGNQGIGFAIIDNLCSRWYQVVEPYSERKGELLSLNEISDIFDDGSSLSKLKGYEKRQEQVKMSTIIAEAFNNNKIALVEAGTGTGKSLAYLIPSILWASRNNERVVISTNTINLQEQLIKKDIPFLSKTIGIDFKSVLVKGRSNYICLRKVDQIETEPALFPDELSEELIAIHDWSLTTATGCKSDLAATPKYSTWESVCCEADQCNRAQCRFFNKCFFYKARRESSSATILVANHSLLLSDIVLKKDNGYDAAAILPPFTRVIIDEGHHLEDVATSHLSIVISKALILKQLHRLIPPKSGKAGILSLLLQRLTKYLPDSMDELYAELSSLIENSLMVKYNDISQLTAQTFDLIAISLPLAPNGRENKIRITESVEKQPFWQNAVEHLDKLSEAINDYTSALRSLVRRGEDIPEKVKEKTKDFFIDISGIEGRLQAIADSIHFIKSSDEGYCRWFETTSGIRGVSLNIFAAPLDISTSIKEQILDQMKTVVVTSATLTAGGSFSYLKQRTGFNLIDQKRIISLILHSPFEYQKKVIIGIPNDIPEPSTSNFRSALKNSIIDAVSKSGGGAFVLFTSFELLMQLYSDTAAELSKIGVTIYRQGDGNRHHLLTRFKSDGNGVLFGTDSFWEGVDVKGDALRLVIITRLPFHVPTEPIQQARSEKVDAEGGNSFRDFSLPQAVIKFRQGFGRLIRSHSDRGAVLILDNRIISKNYGKSFLKSLPDAEIIRESGENIAVKLENFFSHFVDNQ